MTGPAIDPSRLPAPLDGDEFQLLRHGIYTDAATDVFVNTAGDFAALEPLPEIDYGHYKPRAESLGLAAYKQQRAVLEERLEKVAPLVAGAGAGSFLEIGAADGAFLALLHDHDAARPYAAVEPDARTRPARDTLAWLEQFDSAAAVTPASIACVGMFHVFEHLLDPRPMLDDIARLLTPGGRLVIEVPCLLDPLLSVFDSPAYADFYFQRQHPYVYTGASLARVLAAAGFTIVETVDYQRYGFENHAHWLRAGQPGGNTAYRDLFAPVDDGYRRALEDDGRTDTVIVVAQAKQ